MEKHIVFLTGDRLGVDASENLHLYRRIVSFRKSANVAVITSSNDNYAERAGCKQVVHLKNGTEDNEKAAAIARQADMFVVVGLKPNASPSAELINSTKTDCCIAIINKGCIELPKDTHRNNVVKMRDMSIGTGLMFLSMYRWMMDLVEE